MTIQQELRMNGCSRYLLQTLPWMTFAHLSSSCAQCFPKPFHTTTLFCLTFLFMTPFSCLTSPYPFVFQQNPISELHKIANLSVVVLMWHPKMSLFCLVYPLPPKSSLCLTCSTVSSPRWEVPISCLSQSSVSFSAEIPWHHYKY